MSQRRLSIEPPEQILSQKMRPHKVVVSWEMLVVVISKAARRNATSMMAMSYLDGRVWPIRTRTLRRASRSSGRDPTWCQLVIRRRASNAEALKTYMIQALLQILKLALLNDQVVFVIQVLDNVVMSLFVIF